MQKRRMVETQVVRVRGYCDSLDFYSEYDEDFQDESDMISCICEVTLGALIRSKQEG